MIVGGGCGGRGRGRRLLAVLLVRLGRPRLSKGAAASAAGVGTLARVRSPVAPGKVEMK